MDKSVDNKKALQQKNELETNVNGKNLLSVFSGCCKSQSLSGETPDDCCKNKSK